MSGQNNNDGRQLELNVEPPKSRKNLDLQKPTNREHTSDEDLRSKPVKSDENDGTHKPKNLEDVADELLAEELETREGYKVLRKLKNPDIIVSKTEKGKLYGLYVDCETTGFNSESDKIIELAMVKFEYKESGVIGDVTGRYCAFNDPDCEIPKEITDLTHITDKMVKGKKFDRESIEEMLEGVDLVIAHNAKFDRPFLERNFDDFKEVKWACSLNDIPWKNEGMLMGKLDYLALQLGFFFEGHRAEVDCYAGLKILNSELPKSRRKCFSVLLESANRDTKIIWATGAPFDKKDLLKGKGYRWHPGTSSRPKSWYKEIEKGEYEKEVDFLADDIYGYKREIDTTEITAMNRYSGREK